MQLMDSLVAKEILLHVLLFVEMFHDWPLFENTLFRDFLDRLLTFFSLKREMTINQKSIKIQKIISSFTNAQLVIIERVTQRRI